MKKSLTIALALLALVTCRIARAETPVAPTKEASAVANAKPVKRTAPKPVTDTVKHLDCKSRSTHALVQGTGTVIVCEM